MSSFPAPSPPLSVWSSSPVSRRLLIVKKAQCPLTNALCSLYVLIPPYDRTAYHAP
jgi:hypothetical protein